MTVSSVPGPSLIPGEPTAKPGTEIAADGAGIGDFASLLSGSSYGGGATTLAEDAEAVETEEGATTDCGSTDEAEPSPAEQTYLAALLYVRPIPVDPPKPQTAEPEVSATCRDDAPLSEPNEEATSSTAPNRSEPTQSHIVGQRPEVACPVSQQHSAEVAAPISTPPSTQKPGPVNSASAPAVQSAALKSVSPANPDESLIPGQNSTVKKARGTSGAKAVRDMINPSANQANSNSEPQAMRSAAASLTAPAMGLDKDMPHHAQGDAQDQTLDTRSENNRPLSESFSATGASLTAHGARNDATFKVEEGKPMSTAAVIGEVGRGLERIQQHGDNRVDLRLSLEGGGEVTIQLQMRDGAVHASFQTSSSELREALQQGWSQFTARGEASGLQLAPPVFKSPETGSFTTGHQNFRERHQEPPQEQPQHPSTFYPAPNQSKRPGQTNIPVRRSSSGLNAWA